MAGLKLLIGIPVGYLLNKFKALPKDESGQSALFAILTLLLMVMALAYTYNTGITVSQKIRVQDAADAAAYAGALTEANSLSSIAWLNSCQTYLHSRLQNHMLDVVAFSTAAAVCEWGGYTKANNSTDKSSSRKGSGYSTTHFLPPATINGLAILLNITKPPLEVSSIRKQLMGKMSSTNSSYPDATELDEAFDPYLNDAYAAGHAQDGSYTGNDDGSLFSRYKKLKFPTPSNPSSSDIVNAAKDIVLPNAKTWVADKTRSTRRGELWIRQLSIAAAAIAKATPMMIRREAVYHATRIAPKGSHVAIFPDPINSSESSLSIPFSGDVAFSASTPGAFFRYDDYGSNLATNRFLLESRRQGARQQFDHLKTSYPYSFKDVYKEWWDEYEGKIKDPKKFEVMLRCWNDYDRTRQVGTQCMLGYAPGADPSDELCNDQATGDAADGHYHFSHVHTHGDSCRWLFIPHFCFQLGCHLADGIRALRGLDHGSMMPLHQKNSHDDGWIYNPLVKDGDHDKGFTHVYCDIASDNEQGDIGSIGGKFYKQVCAKFDINEDTGLDSYGQEPDMIPIPFLLAGVVFSGLPIYERCSWLAKCMGWWLTFAGPIPVPVLSRTPSGIPIPYCICKPACQTYSARPRGGDYDNSSIVGLHSTNKCSMNGTLDRLINIGAVIGIAAATDSWFLRHADWEGKLSGDNYFYDVKYWGAAMTNLPTMNFNSLGGILNTFTGIVQYINNILSSARNMLARKTHHMMCVCPLCHGACPACSSGNDYVYHRGKDNGKRVFNESFYSSYSSTLVNNYSSAAMSDNSYVKKIDGKYRVYDRQADSGLTYKQVYKHDKSSELSGKDLGVNIDDGSDTDWKNNYYKDRFVREWSSPVRSGVPQTNLAPTVMFSRNLLKYGITVAVYAPQSIGAIFGKTPQFFAISTARVGPVGFIPGGTQIISGVGEVEGGVTWTLPTLESRMLRVNTPYTASETNLYWAKWGAKLVSSRYGILPEGNEDTFAILLANIGKTVTLNEDNMRTGKTFAQVFENVKIAGRSTSWSQFVTDYSSQVSSLRGAP